MPTDPSQIAGNMPEEQKALMTEMFFSRHQPLWSWGGDLLQRIVITDADLLDADSGSAKKTARIVFEVPVTDG